MELSRATIEQYEKLKILGFPINTTSKNPTPTLAFITKWLREFKQLHIEITLGHDEDAHWYDAYVYPIKHDYNYDFINTGANIDEDDLSGNTHDEAESKAIDYCINILVSTDKLISIGGGSDFFKSADMIYSVDSNNRDDRFYSVEEMNCPKCRIITAHELSTNKINNDGGELWTCILCRTQLH